MDDRLRKAEKAFKREDTWDTWRMLVTEQYRAGYTPKETTKRTYKNIHDRWVIVSLVPFKEKYSEFVSAGGYNIFEEQIHHSLSTARLGMHYINRKLTKEEVLQAHNQVLEIVVKNNEPSIEQISFHGPSWIWPWEV